MHQLFSLLLIVSTVMSTCNCLEAVSYSIKEHSRAGTLIGNIGNSTQETRQSVKYSFLLTEQKIRQLFDLNESNGDLRLSSNAVLDREDICGYDPSCDLRLEVAIRSTNEQYFRKVSVDVTVLDINDHAPIFSKNFTTITISESVQIPSSFPLPSALDRDTGVDNSLESYNIEPSDGIFELSWTPGNPNLMLRVVNALDHETQAKYLLRIIARDGGDPPQEGVLQVEIIVEDKNDNRPIFTEDTYSKIVDESVKEGSLLLKLTATDADSGENGKVRYRFSPLQSTSILDMFFLNETSGELFVIGDFQKSETEVYKIDIEAMDPAFTTKKTVTITVEDTINSPPKVVISTLSSNEYSSISEYANLGIAVAHILVRDPDKGSNGIVSCHLDADGFFELQGYAINEFKVIVARPLDRETADRHNVTVICEDSGQNPLTATSMFEVRVLDENDHAPKFTKKFWFGSILENNEEGKEIMSVSATDDDDPDTKNGRIKYRLEDVNPEDFFINPDTGVIKAMTSFDFELRRSFNFTVVAEDNGVPKRSDKAAVGLTIKDENDQAPYFSQDQIVMKVSEYSKPDSRVGKMMAFDFEQGPNGEIEISLVNEKGEPTTDIPGVPFKVDPDGTVTLTSLLDFELVRSYSFRVQVTDKGVPPLTDATSVIVQVQDENDNSPFIIHPNTSESFITTYTGSKDFPPVLEFDAQDEDSGTNGRLIYSITSRNDSGRFQVDQSSGVVRQSKEFKDSDAGIYKLTVLVRDSGVPPLSDFRTLLIRVIGENGNANANGTAGGSSSSDEQYIIIALIIVCVTVLLSVTIVLIIVIMKRMDRRRKMGGGNVNNNDMHHTMHIHNPSAISTFLDTAKMDNFRNEHHGGGGDGGNGGGGGGGNSGFKDKQGPGDFRDFHNDSSDTSMDNNSKKPLDGQFGFSSGSAGDTYQVTNNLNLPTSSSRDEDIDVEALQLRQVLLQTYHDAQVPGLVPEDGASETSGDTITSDSGRGGSDEDVSNSNMAAALNSMDDPRGHNGSFQSNLSTFGQSGSLKSSVKDPVRASSRKHVTFQDMERFRNSVRSHSEQPRTASGMAGGVAGGNGSAIALNQLSPRDHQQQLPYQQNQSPRDNLTTKNILPHDGRINDRADPRNNFNVNSPRGVQHQVKNSPRGTPFDVTGRDSPRLQTFPTSLSNTQPSKNSPRLPFYEGHESPSHHNEQKPHEWMNSPRLPSNSTDSFDHDTTSSSSSSHPYIQMNAPKQQPPRPYSRPLPNSHNNNNSSIPNQYTNSRQPHHNIENPSSSARNSPRNHNSAIPTNTAQQSSHPLSRDLSRHSGTFAPPPPSSSHQHRGSHHDFKNNPPNGSNQSTTPRSGHNSSTTTTPPQHNSHPPPLLPPRESIPSSKDLNSNSNKSIASFLPPSRSSAGIEANGNSSNSGNHSQQKTSLLPDRGRMPRDWNNESLVTTEDGDDNRSTTTTSGSYTIDNEDNNLGFEFHLPQDIVV